MSRKIFLIAGVFLGLLTILNSAGLFWEYRNEKKTIVIDVIRVFNEFKLKKDMEDRAAVKLNDYSAGIDSLKAVYRNMAEKNEPKENLSFIAVQLDTMQYRAQRAYQVSNKRINEEVWIRLNTLINEYGDKYDYKLVIGANGMGTVLYNKKEIDKTEELIKFINSKYEIGH